MVFHTMEFLNILEDPNEVSSFAVMVDAIEKFCEDPVSYKVVPALEIATVAGTKGKKKFSMKSVNVFPPTFNVVYGDLFINLFPLYGITLELIELIAQEDVPNRDEV